MRTPFVFPDGIHAAAGRTDTQTETAPDTVSRRARAECQVEITGRARAAAEDNSGRGRLRARAQQAGALTWARLLKRVFDIDIEHCACGGKLKLIAVIEEPDVIEKTLKHIGLDPQPPPIAPARRRAELFEWA